MNWRTLASLLVVASALIAWSFWLQRDNDTVTNAPARAAHGYYLNDARIRQTGSNGDARYALRAQHIEQDLASNHINLAAVALDYRSDSGASWQLNAERGVLDNAGQRADFSGHVLIRPTSQPGSTTQLLTESLHVDMQGQTANTEDAVTLRMNEQQLTARGLKANLKEQALKLESQVHGVFQIQPEPSSPLP